MKRLGIQGIPCCTSCLKLVCVRERESDVEKTMWCVLHLGHLNVSKAAIRMDAFLVTCVTSERERKEGYYSEKYVYPL
jgi:hypothetical protein